MMGHGVMGIAALLSTAALGYLVCAKANEQKKGSNLKTVGMALGTLIIIAGLLGSLCIMAKSGCFGPKACKWIYDKKMCHAGMDEMKQPGMPYPQRHQ